MAGTHLNLASSYLGAGQKDKAIEEYRMFIEVNRESPGPYLKLGELYYEKGELEKARQMWMTALKIFPDFTDAKECLKKLDKK
jgi:tetratricopeptide (TPR) repeat protein